MTNPIQGKMALKGVAEQLDAQKMLDKSSSSGGPHANKEVKGSSFSEVMEAKQPQSVDQVQKAQAPATNQAPTVNKVEQSPAGQRIDKFVSGVLDDEKKIEKMMAKCSRGGSMAPGELLKMQGVIYGYAQKVDLASKIVDKATGGIKQVMNTQV